MAHFTNVPTLSFSGCGCVNFGCMLWQLPIWVDSLQLFGSQRLFLLQRFICLATLFISLISSCSAVIEVGCDLELVITAMVEPSSVGSSMHLAGMQAFSTCAWIRLNSFPTWTANFKVGVSTPNRCLYKETFPRLLQKISTAILC